MMGVEIDRKYGGPEASFFHLVLALEELAKVDLSVSLMVDLQNTISDALLIAQGTEHQKQYYLPRLARGMVRIISMNNMNIISTLLNTTSFLVEPSIVMRGDFHMVGSLRQMTCETVVPYRLPPGYWLLHV